MIDTSYVVTMARYNAWQNRQIIECIADMKKADLVKDQGAFFGSILATLNHILWGDQAWLSRLCDDVPAPGPPPEDWINVTKSVADWKEKRHATDGRILTWAQTLSHLDVLGDLTWFSGVLNAHTKAPRALCIAHMFNHQTHHRGQVHAMLTSQEGQAPVSDLIFMPEDL
ncbi:MAG: DinB family protein [Pseudomonadota bacterium]